MINRGAVKPEFLDLNILYDLAQEKEFAVKIEFSPVDNRWVLVTTQLDGDCKHHGSASYDLSVAIDELILKLHKYWDALKSSHG